MALIYQLAIELKDQLAERFGVTIKETDNCAGQFFTLDKPITDEMKAVIDSFLSERHHMPIYWDENSFSVRDLRNNKHNA